MGRARVGFAAGVVLVFLGTGACPAVGDPLDYTQCRLIGDLNEDARITVDDLRMLDGVLAGTASLNGLSARADIDQNGILNAGDYTQLAAVVAQIEGAVDFGGMFGACGPGGPPPGSYVNPLTGRYSCPAGYSALRISGTPGFDWPVYVCHRAHIPGKSPDYDFGGMFGSCGPGGPPPGAYVNPLTKAYSCPPGYAAARVAGTPGVDWPLSFCYRRHQAGREQEYDFGGVYGSVYPRPANADTSYRVAAVAGVPSRDHPVSFAFRPHAMQVSNPRFTPLEGFNAPSSQTSPVQVGPFLFPQDEGLHNNQEEWWYVNGHLTCGYGQENFDFMTSFFNHRFPDGRSMGQFLFMFADTNPQRYYTYAYENAPGTYSAARGSCALTYNSPDQNTFTRVDKEKGVYLLRIVNPRDKITLDLRLTNVKPAVPIAENGYITFAANEVSAYYAHPRLFAEGTLTMQGIARPVCGIAWIDRQWGDFDMKATVWEWFSVQLSDNSEVEVMRSFRKASGEVSNTFINYIDASGRVQTAREVEITPVGTWTSPVTRKTYSSGWTIFSRAVAGGLRLLVTPKMQEQELIDRTGNALWEGGCAARGFVNGRLVTGEGFAELTKTVP